MRRIALACATALFATAAVADGGKFSQTEASFKGRGDGLSLVAMPSLELTTGGTIEFWVSPQWSKKLSFDPTVLSHQGEDGVLYSVHITADRQGIGLNSGDGWSVARFDFTDDAPILRHVALVTTGGFTDVYVDGERIATLRRGYFPGASKNFHIGSLDGYHAPFRGVLSGIRIWSVALDPETLELFNRSDIAGTEGLTHPDLWALVGASDFTNGDKQFYLPGETGVGQ